MIFNEHSEVKGKHAELSASNFHWLRYSDEKLIASHNNHLRVEFGTYLHDFAAHCIDYRYKIPKNKKTLVLMIKSYLMAKGFSREDLSDMDFVIPDEVYITLTEYINDGIGFQMNTEKVLYYSEPCFGTTDAISFDNNILRIHDLKTGSNPAQMDQLYVYASLFCLEYSIKPQNIDMVLRIYQNGECNEVIPDPVDIQNTMDIIVHDDQVISGIKNRRTYYGR